MALSCRGTGPLSGFNYRVNHETWRTHYTEDARRISACGQVALVQKHHGRYSFVEKPVPTRLSTVQPWEQVATRHRAGAVVFDQCCLGAKGPRGLPARQLSVDIANSPHLLAPSRNLRCSGRHDHDVHLGHSQRARTLQVWPRR
eukprot:5151723-Pyramimonas_sp.AAC.1